jgi:hypothetical protein
LSRLFASLLLSNTDRKQRRQLQRENFWKTPAAWLAEVKDGKIALWQVFADNEAIRVIMRKYQ